MLLRDGLMKCSILPPWYLSFPFVAIKDLFCLYRSCAIEQNRTEVCTHETALKGTWVLDEIRLAVQKGYDLVELHVLYEYQVT